MVKPSLLKVSFNEFERPYLEYSEEGRNLISRIEREEKEKKPDTEPIKKEFELWKQKIINLLKNICVKEDNQHVDFYMNKQKNEPEYKEEFIAKSLKEKINNRMIALDEIHDAIIKEQLESGLINRYSE